MAEPGTPFRRAIWICGAAAALVFAAVLAHRARPQDVGPAIRFIEQDFYAFYPCEWREAWSVRARRDAAAFRAIFRSRRPLRLRKAAYLLLTRARSNGYEKIVLAAILDREEAIRAQAVHDLPLALSGDDLAAKYIELLSDSSAWVRYNAAEALQRHPCKPAIEPLLSLAGDESIETRDRALFTLLCWKVPEVMVRLRELADSSDVTIAGAAMLALSRTYEEKVDLPKLHQYLRQELGKLTGPPYAGAGSLIAIIHLLGEKGENSSIPALREALQHAHPSVRREAAKAVDRIMGHQR